MLYHRRAVLLRLHRLYRACTLFDLPAGRTLHREKDSSTHPAESKREAKGCI
ncbi:hypothetical protein HMPREF0239_00944 [Clostridium sp. ATCC BAA-442]|nr:hypothetical protein HMPREF0239_00944 [Clostridium sp. ATCC BAA-442]